MKKYFIVFLMIYTAASGQGKFYSVEESLELGFANSKQLKISQAQTLSLKAEITEIVSQMFPQFSFRASYIRLSNIPPFQINIPFLGQTVKIQDPILNNYSFQLSVQQPLFTGFKLLSLKAASINKFESQQSWFRSIQNEVAYNIYLAFWNMYKLQRINELTQKNLERIGEHLKDAKNYLENGLITKNDFLKLKVRHSNLQLNLIDSENNLKIARINFNRLLGIELDIQTSIAPYEILLSSPVAIETLIEEALHNREDLKAAEFDIAASSEGILAAKSTWYPQIFLFGNIYYNNPNQRILPSKDKFYDTWDVGVTLNWSLWNWGYTSSQIAKAEQKSIILQTKEMLKKEEIQIEIYNKYFDMISGIKKIEVGELAVGQSEENCRIVLNKFKNNLASSTELIDAEADLLNAEIQLVSAKIEFELSRLALKKSVGRKIY